MAMDEKWAADVGKSRKVFGKEVSKLTETLLRHTCWRIPRVHFPFTHNTD